MCVLVGGVGAGRCSHWATPPLKMNKSLTACDHTQQWCHGVLTHPGVHCYITAAGGEVKPLEVSKNKIFKGALLRNSNLLWINFFLLQGHASGLMWGHYRPFWYICSKMYSFCASISYCAWITFILEEHTIHCTFNAQQRAGLCRSHLIPAIIFAYRRTLGWPRD